MLLTVPEVAARLDLSRDTVYRLINNGHIPAYRHSRRIYVDSEALDLYVPEPPPPIDPQPVRITELPDDERYLTAAETAGILRCTTAWVRQLIRDGHLPANRNVGRNSAFRIHAASVREYLDRQRVA